MLVAAYGGLRFGELTALRRKDVEPDHDLPAGRVQLNVTRVNGEWLLGTPKTAAGARVVTLPAFLTPILTEHLNSFIHPGSDALVVATRSGRPLARSNWSATCHRATAALALIYQHTERDRDEAIARALDDVARTAQEGNVIPLRRGVTG